MQDAISDAPAVSTRAFGRVGRALLAVSTYLAIVGGLVFVGLVVMSIVSIVGRKMYASPVPGDVELLQMCAAFAAAAFFPYCHLIGGDVKVDFFTHNLPPRIVAGLDALGSFLIGAFGALIAWRTAAGAVSLKEVGETSAVLAWPVWIAQALMVPSFALMAVVGFYMCVYWARLGRGAGT
jgi:TRAP-type C4-dicarboxylate transport system permease small subunit